jgi:hypothetical protein
METRDHAEETMKTQDPRLAGNLLTFVDWAVDCGREFEIEYKPTFEPAWTIRWTEADGRGAVGQGKSFSLALSDALERQRRERIARVSARSRADDDRLGKAMGDVSSAPTPERLEEFERVATLATSAEWLGPKHLHKTGEAILALIASVRDCRKEADAMTERAVRAEDALEELRRPKQTLERRALDIVRDFARACHDKVEAHPTAEVVPLIEAMLEVSRLADDIEAALADPSDTVAIDRVIGGAMKLTGSPEGRP